MSQRLEHRLLLMACFVGLVGVLQYIVVTTWLMQIYPGGNLMNRGGEGYSFAHNFVSDLGRTHAFGRPANPTAPWYRLTLSIAGVSISIFFAAFCHFLWKFNKNPLIMLCLICGLVAGFGYVGIAWNPINVDYHAHIRFVQFGFIAFWCMTVLCAICIFQNTRFPDTYGRIQLLFAVLLGVQIVIMMFGPRSWTSLNALLLQVIAQKVVVYGEILAMIILMIGTVRTISTYYRQAPEPASVRTSDGQST